MEDQQKQPQQPELTQEWIDSPRGCPEIYGNMVNPSWTLHDVRFVVGALIPKAETNPKEGFIVEKRCAITISWAGVKGLLVMLADLVRRYESVNGEIKPLKLAPTPSEEEASREDHPA